MASDPRSPSSALLALPCILTALPASLTPLRRWRERVLHLQLPDAPAVHLHVNCKGSAAFSLGRLPSNFPPPTLGPVTFRDFSSFLLGEVLGLQQRPKGPFSVKPSWFVHSSLRLNQWFSKCGHQASSVYPLGSSVCTVHLRLTSPALCVLWPPQGRAESHFFWPLPSALQIDIQQLPLVLDWKIEACDSWTRFYHEETTSSHQRLSAFSRKNTQDFGGHRSWRSLPAEWLVP